LKAAASFRPDVAIVDIGMLSLNGLDAGRRLKQTNPHLKLIYLTMNNSVEFARAAFQAGASAFVLKNCQSSDLLQAMRASIFGVVTGAVFCLPSGCRRLILNQMDDMSKHLSNRAVHRNSIRIRIRRDFN
jgi:DNA-binding NarL/FixJ family response regulator